MRPLDAEKLEDLRPTDRIKVECGGRKRVGLIADAGFRTTLISTARAVIPSGASMCEHPRQYEFGQRGGPGEAH